MSIIVTKAIQPILRVLENYFAGGATMSHLRLILNG